MDMGTLMFAGALGLMLIGTAALVLSGHLMRMVFGLALLESGASLLLVLTGYRSGASAPIILDGVVPASMVDPVPQALVLTAIVIALGVQALALGLVLRVHRAYGTFEMREIRRRMERDICDQAGLELPSSNEVPEPYPGSPKPQQGEY
jgi:multisubunit Na+/H+ antiporter MnhC subunit